MAGTIDFRYISAGKLKEILQEFNDDDVFTVSPTMNLAAYQSRQNGEVTEYFFIGFIDMRGEYASISRESAWKSFISLVIDGKEVIAEP